MNGTIYIFGDFGNGYTQFPRDYTERLFQQLYTQCTSFSRFIICREDNLVYHGYIKKNKKNGRFLGIVVVLNNMIILELNRLINYFDNRINDINKRTQFIEIGNCEDSSIGITNLCEIQNEIKQFSESIRLDLQKYVTKQTSKTNSSKHGKKKINLSDNYDFIIDEIDKYEYIYVDCDQQIEMNVATSDAIDEIKQKLVEFQQLQVTIENDNNARIRELHSENMQLRKLLSNSAFDYKYFRYNKLRQYLKTILNVCLFLSNVIILVYLICGFRYIRKQEQIINNVSQDVKSLKQLENYNDSLVWMSLELDRIQVLLGGYTHIDMIDLKNGKRLIIGKEYKVRFIQKTMTANDFYKGRLEWKADGCKITDKYAIETTITPINDVVVLSFYWNGVRIASRTWKAAHETSVTI